MSVALRQSERRYVPETVKSARFCHPRTRSTTAVKYIMRAVPYRGILGKTLSTAEASQKPVMASIVSPETKVNMSKTKYAVS
jgi:hypothetical protein